ncbi:MAG: spore maturation protein [Oscillospiraceae bacterium]|nr:spore maturation protein [Oscillospiraceae bacterium]
MIELLPGLLLAVLALTAAVRRQDVYDALLSGAKKGLRLTVDLLPSLVVLFAAISLFRASGLAEALGGLLAPLLRRVGVPEETGLLMLLRPLSGSGALAAASELIGRCGADSLVGRTAAVMIGASETTFYVIAVYFSAAGVKNTRWAIPAALAADLACFLSSAWICRLLWS